MAAIFDRSTQVTRGPRRTWLAIVPLLLAALGLLAATAGAVVDQQGNLQVAVSGKITPRALPRTGVAPIAVSVAGRVSTTDRSLPPQLRQLRIDINRNGRLDYAGLPLCSLHQIQPATDSRALSACRQALVGQGTFSAYILLKGQEPYATTGRLLVFNGRSSCTGAPRPASLRQAPTRSLTPSGRLWSSSSRTQGERGGERAPARDPNPSDRGQRDAKCHSRPELLGHIYIAQPFASSFVITFAIASHPHGTYGTTLTANLAKALGTRRYLTGIEMTLQRRYSFKGKPRSYLSGSCPAPAGFPGAVFPLVRTSFAFAGGKNISSTLTQDCKARG